jgi:hypothetical protein
VHQAASLDSKPCRATVALYGSERDTFGMPTPYLSYLVVSSPWEKPNSGIASILPLAISPPSATTSTVPGQPHHLSLSGGEEAAFKEAVSALKNSAIHSGLAFHEHRE